MTKSLILIVSAFTSLIAVVTLVDGALVPSGRGVSAAWMLGIVVVGVLCWLRWRWHWPNPLLFPALIVASAMLISFALLGVGQSVQGFSSEAAGSTPRGIIDILLGAQGALMLYRMWRDRRPGQTRTQDPQGDGTDSP